MMLKKLQKLISPLSDPDPRMKEYIDLIDTTHETARVMLSKTEDLIRNDLNLSVREMDALLEELAQFEFRIPRWYVNDRNT